MKAILIGLVLAAAGAVVPGTAAAQARSGVEARDDRALETYERQLNAGQYAEALSTASKLKIDPANKEGRGYVAAMRGVALLGLERTQEAADEFARADKLAPNLPDVSILQLRAGLALKKPEIAAQAMDRMIARMPDVVRGLDWELVAALLRNEPKDQQARNEDRHVALARLGYGGDTISADYLAKDAVQILLKRGDRAAASDIARYIDEPQYVENLLIMRRFEPLWSQMAAQAGPHLERARAASINSAKRYYDEQPDDEERMQLFINALRRSGRFDEAIAFRSKLPSDAAAMSSASEDMGWAVNNVALALHDAGRPEEADRLFALLNDAPMPNENWRISMKINRLELLVADGKFVDALPLIEPTAALKGSPYAYQLVRRLRYCTLHGLGRAAEAAALYPELMGHAKEAISATIDGLLCAGQIDAAEKLALSSLDDEQFQVEFVRGLQTNSLTSDDPSVWSSGWKELRRRPAIIAKFDELGRDMPTELLPPRPGS